MKKIIVKKRYKTAIAEKRGTIKRNKTGNKNKFEKKNDRPTYRLKAEELSEISSTYMKEKKRSRHKIYYRKLGKIEKM